MGDFMCGTCQVKREKMLRHINKKKKIRFVTLGPEGTTSSVVANRLIGNLHNISAEAEILIDLYDSFELALDEVHSNKADFILLPNAYGKITQFYWDTMLELVYSFVSETPIYGIAIKNENELCDGKKFTISTCKAVEHLVKELWQTTKYKSEDYQVVEANSTTKSLELLVEDKVDFAMTNASSLENSKAVFISDTLSTEVLWSVFMLR